jgi:hypothetical protein
MNEVRICLIHNGHMIASLLASEWRIEYLMRRERVSEIESGNGDMVDVLGNAKYPSNFQSWNVQQDRLPGVVVLSILPFKRYISAIFLISFVIYWRYPCLSDEFHCVVTTKSHPGVYISCPIHLSESQMDQRHNRPD